MITWWTTAPLSEVPRDDDWLCPEERARAGGFKVDKRRRDFRLGRWTAKRLARGSGLVTAELPQIHIRAARDGAPEIDVHGEPIGLSLSISHRAGLGAGALSGGGAVGCDLELIEPRSDGLIRDFFTERERDLVGRTAHRDLTAALIWSAKESALKTLRVGLRRDTRSIEVDPGGGGGSDQGWHPIEVTDLITGQRLAARWRQIDAHVLTVVRACPPPGPVPREAPSKPSTTTVG